MRACFRWSWARRGTHPPRTPRVSQSSPRPPASTRACTLERNRSFVGIAPAWQIRRVARRRLVSCSRSVAGIRCRVNVRVNPIKALLAWSVPGGRGQDCCAPGEAGGRKAGSIVSLVKRGGRGATPFPWCARPNQSLSLTGLNAWTASRYCYVGDSDNFLSLSSVVANEVRT